MTAAFYPENPVRFCSTSEQKVFMALKKTLPSDCSVFYSLAWLVKERGKEGERPQEKEADFVIVHPKRGLLVLEVKGGKLQNNRGRFLRVLDSGETYEIENPAMQAKANCHELVKDLQNKFGRKFNISCGYGMVLPESHAPTSGFGISMPREIVCYESDLQNLGQLVFEMMRYWNPSELGALGEKGVAALAEYFAPECVADRVLGDVLPELEAAFGNLTKAQTGVLRLLAEIQQALVTGGAGTGKTYLAVEKARQLAAKGKRVLLTCYNRPLAEALAKTCTAQSVDVENFHRLCWLRAKAVGSLWRGSRELPDPDGPEAYGMDGRYFENWLPKALAVSAQSGGEKYDAVIIDEGQDFQPEWLALLRSLLRDPKQDTFYVFFDDNQNLWRQGVNPPTGYPVFRLDENVRNAQEIFRSFRKLYSGVALQAGGPKGGRVEFIRLTDYRADLMQEALADLKERLLTIERVNQGDVAVLTGVSTRQSFVGKIACSPGFPFDFSSVMRFKGLEKPVIILLEMDPWVDASLRSHYAKMFDKVTEADRLARSMLYVALSRARSRLFVIGGEALEQKLNGWMR